MSERLLIVGDKVLITEDSLLTVPVDTSLQDKTVTPTINSQVVTPDVGYSGLNKVTVEAMPKATQATPSIEVDSSGLITASAIQDAGYVVAGTKSATEQLPVQEAQTIMPGVTDKTIEAGKYLTGNQTIKGDANLVPENIAKDVVIFGITGTHQGGEDVSAELTEQDDIIALMQAAIATKSAAGVAEPFAFIAVTYPEGSVCTCDDGVETLTAKNTDGTYVFCVPHDGEWTITSTVSEDSTKTKSQIVEITEEGQFESVKLIYGWALFNEIDGLASGYSGASTWDTADPEVSTDSVGKYILFPSGGGYNRMSYIEPAVDLTEYNTLEIYGHTTDQMTSLEKYFGVWESIPTSSDVPVGEVNMTDTLDSYTIDISKLSGEHYLGPQYAVCGIKVYRLIFS